MPLKLNYYYGEEADQFCFYRIPKALFADACYKALSLEAKVLYGLLLDRMGLSVRNRKMDEQGRVYIFFRLETALEMLGIGRNKGVRLFKELELIGLIERIKQGQGRPAIIYVKNFIPPDSPLPEPPDEPDDMSDDIRGPEDRDSFPAGNAENTESGIFGTLWNRASEPEDDAPEADSVIMLTNAEPKGGMETEDAGQEQDNVTESDNAADLGNVTEPEYSAAVILPFMSHTEAGT
ncbi:MAG: replication initiator protein A, partial [Abditibacteriota bacterium]|nr:replication initiator protein A [Abditibacteriota bacterium]